jgi:bacterioferritin
MHGDPRIIDMLNQVLRKELTGINQYFIHSRMCENWDYEVLTKAHYDESIDEMKHADEIIRRILFLEDVPNMSDYDPIRIGRNVKEQFDNDLALEMAALDVIRVAGSNPAPATTEGREPKGSAELLGRPLWPSLRKNYVVFEWSRVGGVTKIAGVVVRQ